MHPNDLSPEHENILSKIDSTKKVVENLHYTYNGCIFT